MEFDKSLIAQELSLRMHRSNWPLLCLLYLYVKKKKFLPFFHPNFFLSIDAAYCVCTCLLLHLCFVLHRICNVGHLLRVSVFRACLTFVHLFSFCYIYTDWGWGGRLYSPYISFGESFGLESGVWGYSWRWESMEKEVDFGYPARHVWAHRRLKRKEREVELERRGFQWCWKERQLNANIRSCCALCSFRLLLACSVWYAT
jgi:hypothetical protein